MKRTTLGKAAIASLLVATTMVGCNGAAVMRPSVGVAKDGQAANKFAAAAEKALADRDGARAVTAAEAAVGIQPDNATYRQLLGRAYVASGRFASAETALGDAMTLGNSDPRTIISLALVKVGLGKDAEARDLLGAHLDTLPAADYGLAMAMAGEAQEGVRILSQAIHDPSATARTRQNLAYAYALAGRWKDARVMAGEDLAPLAATQRVMQWARLAEPAAGAQRVATLMGVGIDAHDAGQPVALALAPRATDAPTALADAGADIQPVTDSPVDVALFDAASAETDTPVASAPLIQASDTPVRARPVMQPAAKFAMEHRAPHATMQKAAFMTPVGSGASSWVVQLGAYDSAAVAKEKWFAMAKGNAALAAFPVLTSQATVNGQAFHRLAISGFASRNDANQMCRSIRAGQGRCFVRAAVPGATAERWALTSRGRQYASR